MSLFDSIFKSQHVQDMAFGAIKKMAKENGIQYIMINVKPDGELDFSTYKAEDQPVIITEIQVKQMKEIASDYERVQLELHQAETMITELKTRLGDLTNEFVVAKDKFAALTEENDRLRGILEPSKPTGL